jgi:antitoxin MazE
MQTRIQRWGNSLALRIPKAFAEAAGLNRDSRVEIRIVEGEIIITPLKVADYNLDDLLAQVTQDNLHRECLL